MNFVTVRYRSSLRRLLLLHADADDVFVCVKGSICKDCIYTACCGLCVVCQMIRELDSAGWPK